MEDSDLVEVRLLGIPVAIHRMALEHHDGLDREFALLSMQADADAEGIPARLIGLSRQLRERFNAFSAGPRAELQAAMDRGDERIDLTYRVPREAGAAARQLGDLLVEADAYCLAGRDLLTLVAPGKVVTYRNWFIDEFVRQTKGEEPRSWNEVQKAS
jgi:hypothetical protein